MSRSAAWYCTHVQKVTLVEEVTTSNPLTVMVTYGWCEPANNVEKLRANLSETNGTSIPMVISFDDYIKKYGNSAARRLF